MNRIEKLGKLTITLHWLVGIGILCLLFVGIYMAENEVYALYPIHKSFGILLFPVILVRVVWRLKSGWPTPVGIYSKVEQVLSKIVHWILLLLTMLMPVTGMLFSGASGHGFALFGLVIVPANHSTTKPDEVIPYNASMADIGSTMHEVFGYVLLCAILLHVVGALKHHFVDKDATLRRMLGRSTD